MNRCSYCGAPCGKREYCPGESHKNKAWSIRRKYAQLGEAGKIKARHMKLIVDAIQAEQDGLGTPCTPASEAMDMRGMLTQQGEG